MRANALFVIVIASLLLGCRGNGNDPGPSKSVTTYLNEMIEIMQENSVNRNSIDWASFKNSVFEKAGETQAIAETNEVVRHALTLLGEQTSFMVTALGEVIRATEGCTDDTPPAITSDPDVGYLKIPIYSSTGTAAEFFALAKHKEIKDEDHVDLKGWIVDLRGNTGGNMWAMLAAVGPILGSGVAGYFIDADGTKTSFQYDAGKMKYGEESVISISNPYVTVSGKIKTAILVDNATASSGEAVAIAFIGKESTQIFGSNTCGKSAGNQPFALSNGAVLYLTTALLADRSENVYTSAITPDVAVADGESVYDAAAAWIKE